MSSESMLNQERFWEIVKYLVQLDSKKSFDDICSDLNINLRQLNSFIHFLKDVNYQFEHFTDGDQRILCPPDERPQITLEFNLLEWLQFQAHFPAISRCEGKPYHKEFISLLSSLEEKYQEHDLFHSLETLESMMQVQSPKLVEAGHLPQNEIVAFLEEAILDELVVHLQWNEKNFVVYPRKIVFLDGELTLVAEGLNDKCLMNMNISAIGQVHDEDIQWTPLFSRLQIDDFVSSIRAISENETRLVLKVYNREIFNRGVPQHHFEKPCMFTNPEGDFIWAASIEPTEQIYEWLSELGTEVEILDPVEFKKGFLNYCEHKLKKLA